jgi:hypothetical protein
LYKDSVISANLSNQHIHIISRLCNPNPYLAEKYEKVKLQRDNERENFPREILKRESKDSTKTLDSKKGLIIGNKAEKVRHLVRPRDKILAQIIEYTIVPSKKNHMSRTAGIINCLF